MVPMTDGIESKWKTSQRNSKELIAAAESSHVNVAALLESLSRCQNDYQDIICAEPEFAFKHEVEQALWELHTICYILFKKQLNHFRQASQKKKHVERRKTERQFINFIKCSQRRYRSFIQRLATRFKPIPEFEAVAKALSLSTLTVENTQPTAGDVGRVILEFLYYSLIRLGDLSRWRETLLVSKGRNWGPALGYYSLAGKVHQEDGTHHHQMALIALSNRDELETVYRLYRSLGTARPHTYSLANLERQLKKAVGKGTLLEKASSSLEKDDKALLDDLVGSFLRLLASFIISSIPPEREVEDTFFGSFELALNKRTFEAIIDKMLIVSLAAEYVAQSRLRQGGMIPASLQSLLHCLRLNARTFCKLLQHFQTEANASRNSSSDSGVGERSALSGRLTTKLRRLLPWVRQYSAWYTTRASLLTTETKDESLNQCSKELRRLCRELLQTLTHCFPPFVLPRIEYLLEEDESAIGFAPLTNFDNERLRARYCCDGPTRLKPRSHDKGVQRLTSSQEMLGRIKDVLEDGTYLRTQQDNPLFFDAEDDDLSQSEKPAHSQAVAMENVNDITHVSETKLAVSSLPFSTEASQGLSQAISSTWNLNEQCVPPTNPIVRKPNGDAADEPLLEAVILVGDGAKSQAAAKDTTYGPITSQDLKNPIGDPHPTSVTISSNSSETPEPTVTSAPNPYEQTRRLLRAQPQANSQSLLDDAMDRSSGWFMGGNYTLPQPEATPPAGQQTGLMRTD